jgi:hypothetical protein
VGKSSEDGGELIVIAGEEDLEDSAPGELGLSGADEGDEGGVARACSVAVEEHPGDDGGSGAADALDGVEEEPQRQAAGGLDEGACEREVAVEEAPGVVFVPLALLPPLDDVDLLAIRVDAGHPDGLGGEGASDGEQLCHGFFVVEVRQHVQSAALSPVEDLDPPSLVGFYEVFGF